MYSYCDVELNVGKKTFPCVKAILSARSSVFSYMFEKNENLHVVEITDVNPDTLKRMLAYMEFDVTEEDLSYDDALNLYEAAHKYELQSLKSWCSTLLSSNVSVANIYNLLSFADTYQDDFLKLTIRNFMYDHRHEVLCSAKWKTFLEGNRKLACEILYEIVMEYYCF